MDRGAWQATVHGLSRVRHDLVTKPSPQEALVVKNWPATAGDARDKVQSLGQEDPLEELMVTHSSIPTWRIAWPEEPGRLWSIGSQKVRHD